MGISDLQVGHLQEVEILPGVKRTIKTLSMRPLVFGGFYVINICLSVSLEVIMLR